ncbi:MAG: LysM peptidoglycan-binding domain-containing protein [Anaerolineales bacterium]|nr:LysM peptidoglycan-binding domain-containing protein [Anaerolineales bacterium]
MDPSRDTSAGTSRLCPTCGTRLAAGVTRCVVCGSDLRPTSGKRAGLGGGAQVALSLPVALGLLAVFVLLTDGLTVAAVKLTSVGIRATPTITPTLTATVTATPPPTLTGTPEPPPTPLPDIEYTVVANDTCAGLAYRFEVSVKSILNLNNLGQACLLSVGTVLKIPQPTPTPSPEPTATLLAAEATEQACDRILYTVKANDTLAGIGLNYNVELQAIKDFNSMPSDTVFVGQVLTIPLCRRLPTPGPTPTPTPPAPYPAPNLLLPRDGEYFSASSDSVTLQWASVGALRENEFYQVIVEDLTDSSGTKRLVGYATDTKYIVPASFRPNDTLPHILRWQISVMRQTGTDDNSTPIYVSGGAVSDRRHFSWSGTGAPATPTP